MCAVLAAPSRAVHPHVRKHCNLAHRLLARAQALAYCHRCARLLRSRRPGASAEGGARAGGKEARALRARSEGCTFTQKGKNT